MEGEETKIPQIEIQETPINCPVCPPCPVPPKTKPGKAFLKVLFLFILALILAAVILIGSGFQIVRKESLLDLWLARNQAPTPATIVKPTPTPDPTADWKTYTNSQYSFLIKYPDDYFKFQDSQSDVLKNGVFVATSAPQGGNSPKFLGPKDVWLNAGVGANNVSDLDQYIDLFSQSFNVSQKTPVTIDGVGGYRVTYTIPDMAGAANVIASYNFEVILLKNNNIYTISLTAHDQDILINNQKMFDQILSTFKFITVTPTSSPGIQTKGGLSLGIPVKIKSTILTTATGPLAIKGTVDSGWMFEGVMPVLLLDSSRNEIASGSAMETTPGAWQSGNPVNFSISFTFSTEATSGFLVFKSDNPSELPENQKTFELPVKFAQR